MSVLNVWWKSTEIVKHTLRNGNQMAYESKAYWDPKRKQNRPIRKYLSRVDPSTARSFHQLGYEGGPVGVSIGLFGTAKI